MAVLEESDTAEQIRLFRNSFQLMAAVAFGGAGIALMNHGYPVVSNLFGVAGVGFVLMVFGSYADKYVVPTIEAWRDGRAA